MSRTWRLTIAALVFLVFALLVRQGLGQEDSRMFLPLVAKAPPTPTTLPLLENGDFEMGASGWQQESTQGYSLIVDADALSFAGPAASPHDGQWAAWLGGVADEDARLYQASYVDPGAPYLRFWLWIASEEACEPAQDHFSVLVGSGLFVTTVFNATLCEEANTPGWVQQGVDLSDYAGQTQQLAFVVSTNGSLNSNLFLDDIAFVEGPPQRSTTSAPALLAAPVLGRQP